MKTFFLLLLTVGLGVAAYFYFQQPERKGDLQIARQELSEGADKLTQKAAEINTDEIRDELARTGHVVRRKAVEAGNAIANATEDARITAAVKSQLALDKELSALTISVNTTKGIVTLSGTVSSHELIKKAMDIALRLDGVSEVVSTLQVK